MFVVFTDVLRTFVPTNLILHTCCKNLLFRENYIRNNGLSAKVYTHKIGMPGSPLLSHYVLV